MPRVFESLKDRGWLKRLRYLHKIAGAKQQSYLYDLTIPFQRSPQNKGCLYEWWAILPSSLLKIPFYHTYAIKEWNKSNSDIKNAETYASTRKMLANFIRPTGNSTYKVYDPLGIKLLTSLRLGYGHFSWNTNLDLALMTHWIGYVLPHWKLSYFILILVILEYFIFSTLPKLYLFTHGPYDWIKKY